MQYKREPHFMDRVRIRLFMHLPKWVPVWFVVERTLVPARIVAQGQFYGKVSIILKNDYIGDGPGLEEVFRRERVLFALPTQLRVRFSFWSKANKPQPVPVMTRIYRLKLRLGIAKLPHQ